MRSVLPGLVVVMVLAAGAGAAPPPRAAPAPTPAAPAPAAAEPKSCAPSPAQMETPGPDPIAQALQHYVRGRIYMMAQDNVMAVQELRQAAALAPNVHHVWLHLGVSLYDSGNVTSAVEALDKALALRADDPETLYYRAFIARSQNDPKAASAFLTRLLSVAPRGSPFRILGTFHLAQVCQELGDSAGAIARYESVLDMTREPQSYFQRYPELLRLYRSRLQLLDTVARLYLAKGANDKAVAALKEALSERPDVPELLGLLCRAYIGMKDFASARDVAKQWIAGHAESGAGYQTLAEIYQAEGNPQGIVAELETYRKAQPENRILAFQLAAAYESFGRRDEAAALYRQLSGGTDKTQGTSVAAAMKLAELQVQAGKPVEAIETLGNAMGNGLAESAILVRGAQIVDGLADPAKVYQDAQRLVTDDNKNYGLFILVAILAERIKKPAEAVALYDKALARQPKAAIAYSRKADILLAAGRASDALAIYDAAIKAGLDLAVFHRKMGMILEFLDRSDEALAQYRIARQAAPDDKVARYLLAGMLARMGKADEAEAELRALLARFPNEVEALCRLAIISINKNDLASAEKAVAQAQQVDAAALAPKALLAEIRYRQKQTDEAERLARAILAERPDASDVRLLLAHILSSRKQFKEAVAELKSILAADPENLGCRYLMAGLYSEMGDTAAAEQELLGILQKNPNHAPSNNDLGYMWAERGTNMAKAEQMIRAALKSDPDSPAYLDSLGWVMYKQGKFADAAKALQDATRAAPDMDALLWDHLGDAYWRSSRPQDAAKAWQEALKILQQRGDDAKPGDLQKVRQKVESIQAGGTPNVAPLAPKDQLGPGDPKSSSAPQP